MMRGNLKGLLVAITIGSIHWAGARPALATPVSYELVDATATFGDSGTDILTGLFTYDDTTGSSSAEITVTGPVVPDLFTAFDSATSSTQLQAGGTSVTYSLLMDFSPPLGTTPSPISAFSFQPECPMCGPEFTATAVTGQAVPQLPEPATVTLMSVSAAATLWARRRKKPAR